MFTIDNFREGNRVQLHPETDLWMRGARFGEICGFTRNGKLRVRLDKMDHVTRIYPEDIWEIL